MSLVQKAGSLLAIGLLIVACATPAASTAPSAAAPTGTPAATATPSAAATATPTAAATATPTAAATATPTEAATATPTGEATPTAAASMDASAYTLGFSNAFGIGNGFREEQLCTAKAEASVLGFQPSTWIHQDDATYPQLQQFRDLIAKAPSAIIFNPNSPDGLNQAIDEAQAANIKTIAIDAYVTDPETLNLSNDQFNYGYVGAKWLFEQLGGEGNVYYMRGIVGHPADLDRHAGVMQALQENPNIHLLPSNDGVGTDWSPDKGTSLINDLITTGGYDDIDGIWTSGIDQQVVDAIQAAGKDFVPIVGADLKGFVEQLLNKVTDTNPDGTKYDGLTGIAVYNPAAVGGAGVKLAAQVLNGETPTTTSVERTDSQGNPVTINAVFLPVPEAYDNVSDEGKAKLAEIDVEGLDNLWPVSWYIDGLTDYTFDQMLACKGPGE